MKRSYVVMWTLALFVVTIPLYAIAAIPSAPHLGSGISCPTCHTDTANGPGHITGPVSSPAVAAAKVKAEPARTPRTREMMPASPMQMPMMLV